MTVTTLRVNVPEATAIEVTEDTLSAALSDGRTISVPLSWYPRLVHATPAERNNWRFIGAGEGVHWSDLDEDISVEMLLGGWASGESQRSFKRWLNAKRAGLPVTIHEVRPISTEQAVLDRSSAPRHLNLPGFRLHPLAGQLSGHYAVPVSGNWRVTFRFEDRDVVDVDYTDHR